MSFEKLTYSSSECNNYVYFKFYADYFDLDFITAQLELEPTLVKIKKDPVPKKTSWIYRLDAGDDADLQTYLEKLIAILKPKVEKINELKRKFELETKLQFVIDIDIDPQSSTPYFPFDKSTIDFLYKTNSIVDFDIYKRIP